MDTVGDAEQYTKRCAAARRSRHLRQLTRFGAAGSLKERFPGIKALAAPKADRDYPVVSAASICAKVTRDTALRDWAFEPGLTGAALPNRNFGCGYPGGALRVLRRARVTALTPRRRRGDQGVADDAPAAGVRLPLAGALFLGHHQAAAGGRVGRGAGAVVRRGGAPHRCSAADRRRASHREADADDEEAVGAKRTGRLPFGGCPGHLATSSGAGRHAYLRSRKLQRVTAF